MKYIAKAGFIYVLIHPARPGLYKIGVTTQTVEKRLKQHNTKYSEHAGSLVKETGKKWELKEYHSVPDIYYSEREFWLYTGIADLPLRGVEIFPMDERSLQSGLNHAINVGVRPEPKGKVKNIKRLIHNRDWMIKELEGTGIKHIGERFNHIQYTEFQCDKGHFFRDIPRRLANNKVCPICGVD